MTGDKVTKQCTKCGEIKDLSQFHRQKGRIKGRTSHCKICYNKQCAEYQRRRRGNLPLGENKQCPAYLGVVVAERLVKHLFKEVVPMPQGNPGYDFICAKDKKIDVKSACLMGKGNSFHWRYGINKNKIADYFLLLAFNNREDLEPIHQWLIPGKILNHLKGATISLSTTDRWKKYEQPIEPAIICCDNIRGED